MDNRGVKFGLILVCFCAFIGRSQSECSSETITAIKNTFSKPDSKTPEWYKSYFVCGNKAGLDFSDKSIANCTKTNLGTDIAGIDEFSIKIEAWKNNQLNGLIGMICCLMDNNIQNGISKDKQVADMKACVAQLCLSG